MIISAIFAMDESHGIAWKGFLPWHLPAELKLFKQTTQNHHLLMGRKTYESVGKPLPDRTTIVITRQRDYHPEGCLVAQNIHEGIAIAEARGEIELFICGGKQIYEQTFPITKRIYMTVVHTRTHADMFFPYFKLEAWQEIDSLYHPADDKNLYAFTRKILERTTIAEVDKP